MIKKEEKPRASVTWPVVLESSSNDQTTNKQRSVLVDHRGTHAHARKQRKRQWPSPEPTDMRSKESSSSLTPFENRIRFYVN